MATVIYGFVGACTALALIAAGVLIGWKLRGHVDSKRETDIRVDQAVNEQERDRLKREQEAFREMMHYNAEVAYGDAPDSDGDDEVVT